MFDYKQLFIIGNPRSGTSLLRLMMTNHPQICIPPECGFIQWWFEKYKMWSLQDSSDSKKVESFIFDLKKSKKIETWKLDYEKLKKKIDSITPSSYSQLTFTVIIQYAEQFEKNYIYLGDKNNYYIQHLDIINKIFPEAYILGIIRDPRDVVCSYLNVNKLETTSRYKPNFSKDISSIANEWLFNNKQLLELIKLKGNKKSKLIRFEDLIINSENKLAEICEWLNLNYSKEMLNYAENNEKYKLEPSEFMDWKKKVNESPDVTRVSSYISELTIDEIRLINALTSEISIQYGYDE